MTPVTPLVLYLGGRPVTVSGGNAVGTKLLTLATVVVLTTGGGLVSPVRAQFAVDARQVGRAGMSLGRDGRLAHLNAAYRAVPKRKGEHSLLTIPIPIGVLQAIKDSAAFDVHKSYFNAVALANYVLNPPVFYQLKKAPAPTNDVTISVSDTTLVVDLGAAKQVVPDQLNIGFTSRLMDPGISIKGVRASVMVFAQEDVRITPDANLRGVLKQADTVRTNTTYSTLDVGTAQGGFAPSLGWAGRLAGGGDGGSEGDGIYLGLTAHYYYGVAFGSANGSSGFTTGNPLFVGSNTVTPQVNGQLFTANRIGHEFGKGFGGDIGLAYIAGPLELGIGVNDIGATMTWKDVQVRQFRYDTAGNQLLDSTVANHVQATTKLPITFAGNILYHMPSGLTLGGEIVNYGRGATVHVGGEQHFGPLIVRAGVARDQRKLLQYGGGLGLRLGFISFDAGVATTSNSLSSTRGAILATSVTIY